MFADVKAIVQHRRVLPRPAFRRLVIIMSRSNDAGHFFQTSSALATTERKAQKAKNKYGKPVKFPSKILAVIDDPRDEKCLYIAEAAGEVKRIDLEVCMITFS